MGASKEDIKDFQVIISEGIRLQKLINKSYELYSNDFDNKYESIGATIDIPKDVYESDTSQKRFQFHLSSLAQRKLREITNRQIKQSNLSYELTVSEYVNDIKDLIYIHIKEGIDFDSAGCSSLLTKAYKRAKCKMEEVRYYFPFNAANLTPDKDVYIGSVIITHKDNIYSKIKNDKWLGTVIDDADQTDYNSFLSIEIPKCSDNISYKRAQNVADLVYGIIKVFAVFHQAKTDQIMLKKNPSVGNTSHYVTCTENEYNVCGSFSFPPDLDQFWRVLEEDFKGDLGGIIAELIELAISPTNENCLADRLIDSFYWFGDASRDNNEHAQVVKLVTAMEKLVSLEKESGVTSRFRNRVSCSIAIFHGEIEKWKEEARQIYELRSDLVHGTQTIYKSYDLPLDFYPFKLACYSILSSCIGFGKLGLEMTNYKTKLQEMYLQLNEHCKNEKYKEKR